jgi:hypothetical protein
MHQHASIGGVQQAAVLVGQMGRAMPRRLFQIGPFAIHEVQHQQPAESQPVPMAKAGPQQPQIL